MRSLQLGIAVMILASSTSASATRKIFNFSTYVDIENSHLRPNGDLLLSTFDNASLFEIDPSASDPQAKIIDQLPSATALCGIASVGHDKFAIIRGIRDNYSYTNETVYIVDYSTDATWPTISVAATLPNAIMPVFDGYVYYNNTSRNTLDRISITVDGLQNGDVEVITQLDPGAFAYDWDGFILDAAGFAYVATRPSAIGRFIPDAESTRSLIRIFVSHQRRQHGVCDYTGGKAGP